MSGATINVRASQCNWTAWTMHAWSKSFDDRLCIQRYNLVAYLHTSGIWLCRTPTHRKWQDIYTVDNKMRGGCLHSSPAWRTEPTCRDGFSNFNLSLIDKATVIRVIIVSLTNGLIDIVQMSGNEWSCEYDERLDDAIFGRIIENSVEWSLPNFNIL